MSGGVVSPGSVSGPCAEGVSVLMPLYNARETVLQAVRSILWQSYRHWELVIVDDGSSDGSLGLLEELARQDGRIRLLARPHRGIVGTLREGLELCRYPLVARMDADDISHPQRLALQVAYLAAHPEVDVVGSLVRIFPKIGITTGMARYERWLNQAVDAALLERDIFVESPLVHPSTLFRREAVLAVGGYLESDWPEDYYLWLRLWLAGHKLAKVERPLLFWRDGPKRLTRTDSRCGHDSLRDLKIEMFLRACYPQFAANPPSLVDAVPACPPSQAVPQPRHGGRGVGRPLLIWGAGPNGKALAKGFQARGLQPAAFVDIRSARRGQTICGMPVLGIDQLPSPRDFFLVTAVGNPYSREEIRQHLDGHGWVECRDYRCMAGISD